MIKTLFKLALTVVVCVWIVSFVPVSEIGGALGRTDLPLYLAGLSAFPAMRLLSAWRMKLVSDTQNMNLSYPRLLRLHLSANFYAMLLPGVVLGGAATWLKYIQAGASKAAAFASVLVNRLVSILVLFSMAAVALAIDSHGMWPAGVLVFVLAMLMIGVSASCVFVYPYIFTGFVSSLGRLPVLKRTTLSHRLTGALSGFDALSHASLHQIVLIYLLSALFEICAMGAMAVFAMALGIDLSLLTIVWLRGAVLLVQMLPISISGLGVREATLLGLTAPYGVDPAAAVAWSLIIFSGSLMMALVGGLLELHALFTHHRAREVG